MFSGSRGGVLARPGSRLVNTVIFVSFVVVGLALLVTKITFKSHHGVQVMPPFGVRCSFSTDTQLRSPHGTRSFLQLMEERGSSNAYDQGGSALHANTSSTQVKLEIIVLTMSRAAALQRLLESLVRADYLGDSADLRVLVDRAPDTGGVDEETVESVTDFHWPHGQKRMVVQGVNQGLERQWIHAWPNPLGSGSASGSSPKYVIILEDDLEVSPLFWEFVKGADLAYGSDPRVAGYTLQRATLRANQTLTKCPILVDSKQNPAFMYRLVGSWGFAPKAAVWRDFLEYYWQHIQNATYDPSVKNLVPSSWYKRQRGKGTMWTMWFIRFCHERDLFVVYGNFVADVQGKDRHRKRTPVTLAANWRESGVHYNSLFAQGRDFDLLSMDARSQIRFPLRPVFLDWDGEPMNDLTLL
ncbi:hypothetical protein FVE85_6399 [Porphyridium purpureum]|uniref:Uncharacterized protein n=1 Tax=Porphyridium purpureum TaxID=35688 RepID=A0A5J4Z732_PORPP|nr:hypothetical protein FVE85_6399 [Porphyridium purpureum]|eukprot:POR7646..scf295_1